MALNSFGVQLDEGVEGFYLLIAYRKSQSGDIKLYVT